jgi:hypothetical protein
MVIRFFSLDECGAPRKLFLIMGTATVEHFSEWRGNGPSINIQLTYSTP